MMSWTEEGASDLEALQHLLVINTNNNLRDNPRVSFHGII